MDIANWKITNENLLHFERLANHNNDCVINALQILGLIDSKHAGIMRILVKPGYGVQKNEFQSILQLLYPSFRWKFIRYTNVDRFIKKLMEILPNGTVSFCGIKWREGSKHVFLVGKALTGEFVIIDGQRNPVSIVCDASRACENYLNDGEEWYIMKVVSSADTTEYPSYSPHM